MTDKTWPWKKFERWEFACRCGCGYDTVDASLILVLLDLKKHFNCAIVRVTSGCRCVEHNTRVGGAWNSQHRKGRAADFTVEDVEPQEVYDYLCSQYPKRFGIGLYSGWVHVDTRSTGVWRQDAPPS